MKFIAPFFTALFALLFSCQPPVPVINDQVIIRQINDPEMLNPVNYTDARAGCIMNHLFQKLIDVDYQNPTKTVPVLAEEKPTIQTTKDGNMLLTFSIRKEAKWDNGRDITARDVDFTIKTFKCPLVNNPNSKSFFDFITGFEYDKNNPKKFTVKTDTLYFAAEATFADMPILPEYIYDSTGLLKKISVERIAAEFNILKSNKDIIGFANNFNSEKYMYNPSFIQGSGAYQLSEWKKNDYIILTKKENWWGSALQNQNVFFESYPSKLIFKTISDATAALVALQSGNIDVLSSIKSKMYSDMLQEDKTKQNFNLFTVPEYSYLFISFNTLNPILSDQKVRQAIAHITDKENMTKVITYNQAEKANSPIHPSKKNANKNIQPYEYNLAMAEQLFSDAGWKDSNKDGILDKVINGKKTELELNLMIGAGNEERKSIALLFLEEAQKAGIKINIQTVDWSVYLERCSNHNFDMMIGKWASSPGPDDLYQCFHTSSANGGANYGSYSNQELDSTIASIRYEINEEKRNNLYKQAQEIIHRDVPLIFLYIPMNRMAISKKFENVYPSLIQPGYWAQGFKRTTP